jgi:hypothetical protein
MPTEAHRTFLVTTPGVFSKLYYATIAAAPGAGKSWNITMRVNGATPAGSLSATIADTNQSGSDLVHTVSVVAGDTVDLLVTGVGTPSGSSMAWSVQFDSTNTAESMLNGNGGSEALSTSSTQMVNLGGADEQSVIKTYSTGIKQSFVSPISGTIKNLYVKLGTAPGEQYTRTFTVFVNGTTSTDVTCTVPSEGTTASDAVNSVAVTAGDYITILSTVSGTPVASTVSLGITFEADVDGYFIVSPYITNSVMDTSTAQYMFVADSGGAIRATEDGYSQDILGDCTIKNCYIALCDGAGAAVSPGDGNTYTFTLRKMGEDTALAVAITGAATSGNSSVDVVATGGQRACTKVVPDSSPTGVYPLISYGAYIASDTFTPQVIMIQ